MSGDGGDGKYTQRICEECDHARVSYETRHRLRKLEEREAQSAAEYREHREFISKNQEAIGKEIARIVDVLNDIENTLADLAEAVWAG